MNNNRHERKPIVVIQPVHLPEVEVGQAVLRIHQQIAGVGVRVEETDLEELPRGALDALLDDALLLCWRGSGAAPFVELGAR